MTKTEEELTRVVAMYEAKLDATVARLATATQLLRRLAAYCQLPAWSAEEQELDDFLRTADSAEPRESA